MAGALSAAPSRVHVAGLLLGAAGTVLAIAGISGIGDAALLPVLAVAILLGAMFVWLDYGFAGGLRALLVERDGRALGAAFVVPAVAALVVLPVGTLVEGYGRFVAPIGLCLLVGAAIFGVGMQITNGCGSGTLVAAGQGSRRMWVALPFSCFGGVLGSLTLPAALRLPSLGEIDLPVLLGPWGGLVVTEALLGLGALVVLRGALLAAAGLGRLRHGTPIGWRGATGAVLGGLLMGVGARLSFGCNVGAFLGGASSGSLHGFVWLAAAMPGCWIGIKLRPIFGMKSK